jgi:hypothetical protein
MAQPEPTEDRTTPRADRVAALDRLREVQDRLWAATQDLSDDERDALVRDVTEAVDDAVRRKALAIRAAQTT